MKDYLKRLNELAGTNTPLKETLNESQELYGNSYLNEMLQEQNRLNENVDEDIADQLAAKKEESGESEEGDLGDDEKPTLSNSALIKGLKRGAEAIADSIPNALNDEFADVMNSVKDIASDKQKMLKLIRFIQKLK